MEACGCWSTTKFMTYKTYGKALLKTTKTKVSVFEQNSSLTQGFYFLLFCGADLEGPNMSTELIVFSFTVSRVSEC